MLFHPFRKLLPDRKSNVHDDLTIQAPLQAVNAAAWLESDQRRLLNQVLPWLGLLLFAGTLVMIGSAIFSPPAWQRYVMVGLMVGGVIAYWVANRLCAGGRTRLGSYVIISAIICITVGTAFMYQDMRVPFQIISVLLVILASVLISRAAGYRLIAILFLINVGLGLFLLYHEADLLALSHLAQIVIDLFILLISLTLSAYLVALKSQSTQRALDQLMVESRKLQKANCQLEQDLVALAKAEEQRLALLLERERVRILADFIRDASHEFRTPLSVVNTNLYLLEHRLEGEDRGRLVVIKKQVDYVNHLLESLLEMSRLDGSTEFSWGAVDMNDLAGDVLVNLQRCADEKGLALIFLPGEIPLIQGDLYRLHLALTNVVQNALDYTTEGRVTLETASQNGHVILTVRDTGPGIPQEIQPRIFDRFYRGDRARTSRGVGLGLAMVRKVAEIHSGKIEVESQPGSGSTFRLILPVNCPAPVRPE